MKGRQGWAGNRGEPSKQEEEESPPEDGDASEDDDHGPRNTRKGKGKEKEK
jgi:hypothetical protein